MVASDNPENLETSLMVDNVITCRSALAVFLYRCAYSVMETDYSHVKAVESCVFGSERPVAFAHARTVSSILFSFVLFLRWNALKTCDYDRVRRLSGVDSTE